MADFHTYFVGEDGVWVHNVCVNVNVNVNNLNHIFGQSKHKLGPLVDRFGGDQIKAYKALERAGQEAFDAGKMSLKNGVNNQTIVTVNNLDVDLIGGKVINGKFNLSSASRRDIL